jgi:hypothetical protein
VLQVSVKLKASALRFREAARASIRMNVGAAQVLKDMPDAGCNPVVWPQRTPHRKRTRQHKWLISLTTQK